MISCLTYAHKIVIHSYVLCAPTVLFRLSHHILISNRRREPLLLVYASTVHQSLLSSSSLFVFSHVVRQTAYFHADPKSPFVHFYVITPAINRCSNVKKCKWIGDETTAHVHHIHTSIFACSHTLTDAFPCVCLCAILIIWNRWNSWFMRHKISALPQTISVRRPKERSGE